MQVSTGQRRDWCQQGAARSLPGRLDRRGSTPVGVRLPERIPPDLGHRVDRQQPHGKRHTRDDIGLGVKRRPLHQHVYFAQNPDSGGKPAKRKGGDQEQQPEQRRMAILRAPRCGPVRSNPRCARATPATRNRFAFNDDVVHQVRRTAPTSASGV